MPTLLDHRPALYEDFSNKSKDIPIYQSTTCQILMTKVTDFEKAREK
jgi:hypothetical protein